MDYHQSHEFGEILKISNHYIGKMAMESEFGTVAKTSIVYKKQGQAIETYQLDKRQSIAVTLFKMLLPATNEKLPKTISTH